ncbi:MAG TPA: hypothetical protein P5232_01360 [Candidatus Moranbacteria bacterium]|nr:hypothetical protein [Candidatus Moranbacteria bacterium]
MKKILIIILFILVGLFIFFQTNFGKKIVAIYQMERIKRMAVSQIDLNSYANFILTHFKDASSASGVEKITRDDLVKMKIRKANASDLPAIVALYNKGFKKGVWCDSTYKASTWSIIKEYQELKNKYGEKNIYFSVAELDGKILAAGGGFEYDGKANHLFTFINVDVTEKLWSQIAIKITTSFFELARSLNLEKVEAKVEKDVWMEGFIRDVIKAKNTSDITWEIDRDFNLSRTWTREDYEYENDAVKKREEKNARGENSDSVNQQSLMGTGKIISQTENTDTFSKKDGTREMLIYPSAVNIKIDGKWTKIEDYLKQSEEISEDKSEAGKKYQLKPYDAYAGADEENRNIINYQKDDNQISFSLENISYKDQNKNIILAEAKNGDIAHSYKSVNFKNIFEGIDLKYHSTINGIKEELFFNNVDLLKKIDEPDYFQGKVVLRTKINVSPNISVEMLNNQVYFKKDGQNLFSTSQPFIFDQENRTYQVESELKKEQDNYYLEITLDYGWLTSEEKVFPLVLDPDLNINPTADVSLCLDSSCAVNNGTGRAFIKFDISGLPAGATLQSANLVLTHITNYATLVISARRFIDQTWSESSAVSVFNGGSFGSVLSSVTVASATTETWNVLGSSSDGLIKEYNDGNTFYSVNLYTSVAFTPAYVSNGTTLVLGFYNDGKTGYSDTYHSREGTTKPVLKISYVYCGDGMCNGNETNGSCPSDCPPISTSNGANSSIFDYNNHPSGAKSIFSAPGTTKTYFHH